MKKMSRMIFIAFLAMNFLTIHATSKGDIKKYHYFFLEAIRQQEVGNLSAAFDLLMRAKAINPNAPEVYYQLAGFYIDLKNPKEAGRYFEKATQLDPQNSTYLEKLGQFYLMQQESNEKALEVYERLYDTNKSRADVVQILYRLYGIKNDYAKAIEMLDRLEVLQGSSEDISLTKMQVYAVMGNKKKELSELQSLVDRNPLELNYKVMLGNWLFQEGRKKEALKNYQAVLKEEPDNVYAQLSLLDYYKELGDKRMVEQLTEKVLQSPKADKEAKMALLRAAIVESQSNENKDSLEVMRLFDRVLVQPQEDADLYLMKAAYFILQNKPDSLVNDIYETALEVEPDNYNARISLIQNIWKTADYDKVIQLARTAQDYNPAEMAFYYFEGLGAFMKKDNDRALTAFRKGVGQIKQDSNREMVSDFYAIMGDILHEKGLDKEAFEVYDSCLQWRPDNIAALNNYAYYLSLTKKDLAKAEQMSYKTVKAEPTNSTYLDTYAWILFLQARYQEAKTYIEQAIANDSTLSNVVSEHAGDIYFQAGEPEKALEYWEKSLKDGNESATLRRKIKLKKYIAE